MVTKSSTYVAVESYGGQIKRMYLLIKDDGL